MSRKIIVAAQTTALKLKDSVVEHLKEKGYDFTDVTGDKEMSYVEAGSIVGRAVSEKQYDLGIVMCGSGMGVNLAANRFPGVFCGLVENINTARSARVITNCNVLAMGSNIVAFDLANKMVDAFLEAEFLEGLDEAKRERLDRTFHEDMLALDRETHGL